MNGQTINTQPAATPPANQTDGDATAAVTTPNPTTPPAATPPAPWQVNLDKDFADILQPQADKLKEYGFSPENAQKLIDEATIEMKNNAAAIAAEDKAFEAKHGGAENAKEVKNIALSAMQKVGVEADEAAAITKIFGSNKVYDVFYNISKLMGTDNFKNIEGGGVVYQPGNMSAENAAAEVAKLRSDEAFMAKIANDDPEANAKLNNLIDMQYGVKK